MAMYQEKNGCHRTLSKKIISNLGFSLIDFCQKNCNSMRMAHALANHVFFISTNQMQPRCQSCVEFNGGFRGWPLFLLIELNPLQAVAKGKCGKLPFPIIATTHCHHMARHYLLPPTNAFCDSPKPFKNQLCTSRPLKRCLITSPKLNLKGKANEPTGGWAPPIVALALHHCEP